MTTTIASLTQPTTYTVGRDRDGFYRIRRAGGYLQGRRFVHQVHAEAAAAECNQELASVPPSQ